MSEDKELYSQSQKKKTRSAVLKHAVRSLTEKRNSSPLVTSQKFRRLADYCVQFIMDVGQGDL
jgi:hypothetical protein